MCKVYLDESGAGDHGGPSTLFKFLILLDGASDSLEGDKEMDGWMDG